MKTRSFLAGTIALALTAFTGSAAMAVDNTFQPSSGDWHTASNWSQSHVPTLAENVVVPSGQTCNLSSGIGHAASLNISGTLNVSASLSIDGTFSISASGTISTSAGAEILVEAGSSATLPALLSLPGSWDLQVDNSGTLNVDGGFTFGVLLNSGTVNVDGTLLFNGAATNDGTLDVAGGVDFGVAAAGSGDFKANAGEIEFSAASTSITGHFYVQNGGLLDIQANVATSGDLKEFSGSGSQIIIAAGKYFQTN